MATARLITKRTAKTVYVDEVEVNLTVSVHEAQLIREFAGRVASEEGDSAMGISDALFHLVLPETYTIGETVNIRGRRPKGID